MKLPRAPKQGDPLEAAWAAEVIAYLRSITPGPSPDLLPTTTPNGTTFRTTSRRPLADAPGFFEVIPTGDLKVKVTGGPVMWHHHDLLVDAADIDPVADAMQIWLEADPEFPADLLTPPDITIEWTGSNTYGATLADQQPNMPSRKKRLLATLTVAGGKISDIDVAWTGPVAWPGVWGFWRPFP